MSYQMFRQKCQDCGASWNAAFGVIGTTQIAAPPTECPYCTSTKLEHAGFGWLKIDGSPTRSSNTHASVTQ